VAGLTERLALIIDANSTGAVRSINQVSTASAKADTSVSKLSATNAHADKSTSKLGHTSSVAGDAMKFALAGGAIYAGSKLLAFAGDSVAAASDLAESQNKTKIVFGQASAAVLKFGENAADSLGMSENAAISAAAGFGSFFDAANLSEKASADMSTELVGLSSDLASFSNLDPTDVLAKLRSGLAGEAEPLRALGVFLSEAAVKSKAMQMGLVGAHGELSEGARIQARYELIMEQTTKAQGDFARTSDGLANKQRILNAELEDTKAAFGEKLIPIQQKATETGIALLEVTGLLLDGYKKLQDWEVDNKPVGETIFGSMPNLAHEVVDAWNEMFETGRRGGEGTFEVTEKVAELTVAEESASAATEEYTTSLALLSDPLAAAKDRATALGDAFGVVWGGLDRLTASSVSFEGDLDKLTEKFGELEGAERTSAQALDIHEESGRDTVTMLQNLRDDAGKAALAVLANGGSAKDAAGKYSEHAAQIDAVIGKLGINRAEAVKLIGQYDQIPSDISTAVRLETIKATTGAAAFQQVVNSITGKTVYIDLMYRQFNSPGGGRSLRGGELMAEGGPVTAGAPYIVGEKGPELFVPGQSGAIVPNGMLTRRGGMGGGDIHIHVGGSVVSERDLVRSVRDGLARMSRRGDPAAA